MEFRGFQRVSLLDYPGKIAVIVFVGGCNLKCGYCYNRSIVLNSQQLPAVSDGEILEYMKQNKEWIDGLVVTGGEPTIYQELPDFLREVKALGICVKIDTNGSNPDMLSTLIKKHLIDYIAMDIKAPLSKDNYMQVVGEIDENTMRNISNSVKLLLSTNGFEYEFRTTVVPDITTEQDISSITKKIAGAKKYYLQQFKPSKEHIDSKYSTVAPLPLEQLNKIRDSISDKFPVCKIRGGR